MKAYIDIENSRTKKVITYELNIIEYVDNKKIVCDISNLKAEEIINLKNAINEKLTYTDIELFFTDYDEFPNFGPDYRFNIENNSLIGIYCKENFKKR